MATRNLQFFGMPAETVSMIASVAQRLDLHLVLYLDGQKPELRTVSADLFVQKVESLAVTRIYLSSVSANLASVNPDNIIVASLQWLMIDLPRVSKNQLSIAAIGAKSDWFDASNSEVRQVPEVLKFFKRVTTAIKPSLCFPVWAWNRSDNRAVVYKDLGYLNGAKEFIVAGGEWVQDKGSNTLFSFEPPREDRGSPEILSDLKKC